MQEPSVTVYRSGPYLVRGPIRVIDEDGSELVVRRAVVPLCRCGRSRTKPICDGSHGAALAAAAREEASPRVG
jgi:CDGSH-type Zn-finger protein